MKIVVATTKERENWLADCLKSIPREHEVIVLTQHDYELGKIKWIYDNTNIDEFLFIQDSVIIKDSSWLDLPSGDVSLSHKAYFMYMGKYTRKTLSKIDIPTVTNKREAVRYEDEWTARYVAASDQVTYLWPLFDTNVFEERHGRQNMILENDFIIKYKGCWNPGMIKE